MKISVIVGASEESFKRLHDTGFSACDFQLGGFFSPKGKYGDIFNVTDEQIIEEFTKIKGWADKYGIEVYQTHGSFTGQVSAYESEEHYIRLARADFLATKTLGCKYCIQHPYIFIDRRYDVNLKFSVERAIEVYRQYIPALEETGVICCLENMHHGDLFYRHRCATTMSRAKELVYICDQLGKNFAICLDTGHCMCTQDDPVEAIKIIGDRLVCLHVHDNDGMWDLHTYPYSTQGVPPRYKIPRIDWTAIMTALKEVGYKGTLNFETGPSCPPALYIASFKYLSAIGRHLVRIYENA